MGKAWATSIRNDAFSKIREYQDTKVLSFFQVTKGKCPNLRFQQNSPFINTAVGTYYLATFILFQ